MTNTEHLRSWAAGLIDGEGCFTVVGRAKTDGNRSRTEYWRPELKVHMRDDNVRTFQSLEKALGPCKLWKRAAGKVNRLGQFSKPTTEGNWRTQEQVLRVVGVLDAHPPLGKKGREYKVWRKAVLVYVNKELPYSKKQALLRKYRETLQAMKKYEGIR